MSVIYCFGCDTYVDTDSDVEHEEEACLSKEKEEM